MKAKFDPIDIICLIVLGIVGILFGLFVLFDKKENVPMLADIFRYIIGLLIFKKLLINNNKSSGEK